METKSTHQQCTCGLADQLKAALEKIPVLEKRIKELETRINKDSTNSSRPPSSDGLKKKVVNVREPSGKKVGGQKGHAGATLAMVSNPDEIIDHSDLNCKNCCADLSGVDAGGVEKRQEIEVCITRRVVEHRKKTKVCPQCKHVNPSKFPQHVRAPVQYGTTVHALVGYLHAAGMPIKKLAVIMNDVCAMPMSQATITRINSSLASGLDEYDKALTKALKEEMVLHADETGVRTEGTLAWLHVACTKLLTYLFLHEKRGSAAVIDADVLPNFGGTVVHDCLSTYFNIGIGKNALCNAHILRELKGLIELKEPGECLWAKQMYLLLLQIKASVEEYQSAGTLPDLIKHAYEQRYDNLVAMGLRYHASLPSLTQHKRGKQKQRDGKNLLDRFKRHKNPVLLFMNDFSVPFTNNQAERDLRPAKTKMKVSGCFRTFQGAQQFFRLFGYISTARKRGVNVLDALNLIIRGNAAHLISGFP